MPDTASHGQEAEPFASLRDSLTTEEHLSPPVTAAWRHMIAAPSLSVVALGRFVSDVAWLLWQKSAALLPRPQPLQEDREPPPLDLAALRQEMAALRQAAVWLGRREVAHLRSFARPAALVEQPIDVETSLADLRLDSLAEAYRLVLARQLPPTVPVASDPYPLEQMLAQLRDHLTDRPSLSFQELLDRYQDRRQQVACFLALLELARRGEVTAQQQRLWGDILIERRPRFLGRSTTDST